MRVFRVVLFVFVFAFGGTYTARHGESVQEWRERRIDDEESKRHRKEHDTILQGIICI